MSRREKKQQRTRKRSQSRSRQKHKRKQRSRSDSRRKRHKQHRDKHRRSKSNRSRSHRSPQQQRGKYYKEPPPNPSDIVKELPCFEPSGILLEYYNNRQYLISFNYRGVALKFHEPAEARIPQDRWRMYPFKNGEPLRNKRINLAPIVLANQSCYLLGKDDRICDILLQNPSISRQHAVIQFRQINKMTVEGHYTQFIKPYVLDLDSSNGTFLNGDRIPSSRYVELLSEDRLKFGTSQREYVMIKEQQAIPQ